MKSTTFKPASLTFENITFSYQAASGPAITDINLAIKPGELVVLVGPSGCGKSTLLRLVAGLIQPDRGRLLLDGRDVLGLAPERRQVGWVPQSYALFEHLNVADNIAFGLRMQGVPKAERKVRVEEMLELCHIPELAHRSARELSGGQRQRVAIARALAIRPRVLLLDEPLAALDPQLRQTLRARVAELLRDSGVTTLFVTHDQSEALAIADRIAVLRAGQLEQYGAPEQLWNRPVNEFVAGFLSGAHLLQARRVGQDQVEIAPGLVARVDPARLNGEVATVALRPSDLQCISSGLATVVLGTEYVGGSYLVTGQIPGGPHLSFLSEQPLSPGATVTVGLRSGAEVAVVGK
jgi:ABC-type Fe3+/spermidine/putrescine transport system ATPase subunit